MAPTSDTTLPLDLETIQKLLAQETKYVQNHSNIGNITESPTPIKPHFTTSLNHLSVPLDIRNYLLSPPPPPIDESWESKMESPPTAHKESYQSIFSSKKKLEKAKKKGCTVEGITYFIGENVKSKPKKKKKDLNGAPGIIVQLCED